MKNSLIFISISIAAIGSTLALAYFIRMDSFAFAWALNFLLMIWVSALIEIIKSPLLSSYFDEKTWERRGKIYEYLGINFFRKILVLIGWEKVIRKSTPLEKNAEALVGLHHQTKKSELGHFIIFFIVLAFNIVVAMRFGLMKSMWLFGLNILLNLYPVILQRYNRPRIARVINMRRRK